MLTKEQAFLATFKYLDTIYYYNRNEGLGDLLSSMNPYLFKNSRSADPAVWVDWKKCVDRIENSDNISRIGAFNAMVAFLQYYQYELGFDFEDMINSILSKGNNEDWIECINAVK